MSPIKFKRKLKEHGIYFKMDDELIKMNTTTKIVFICDDLHINQTHERV